MAVCGLLSNQGRVDIQEAVLSINVLEMQAEDPGIQGFTKLLSNIHIHF